MQALSNYSFDFFVKSVETELGEKLDFETSDKFPEHLSSYTKYLSKNLAKNSATWKKTIENVKELEVTLTKAAMLTNGLSQNMLEFYNNVERLNMVINRKDEITKKLFLDAYKFFYDLGGVIRQKNHHEGACFEDKVCRSSSKLQQ